MKKLPVFLASLSLVANVQISGCVATGEEGEVEDAVRSEWLGENKLPDYLEINSITLFRRWDGAASRVTYNSDSGRAEDQIKKMYFLTMNYKEGVTEEEADVLVQKYRGGEASWIAGKLVVETAEEYAGLSGYSEFDDEKALTDKNRPGILYYALEVGATETRWVQGKLNYRGCLADFQAMEEPRMGSCYVQDYGGGALVLENSTKLERDERPTTNEEVGTWTEEWSKILLTEVAGMDEEFVAMDKVVAQGQERVAEIEKRLKEIGEVAMKTNYESEIAVAIGELEAKIRQWRAEQAVVAPTSKPSYGPSYDPGYGGQAVTGVDEVTGEVDKLVEKDESGAGKDKRGDNSVANSVNLAMMAGGVGDGAEEEVKMGSDEEQEKSLGDNGGLEGNRSEEAVEVPVLGGAEKKWNWWLLVMAGLGILGIAVWCGKKLKEQQR